jgi:hypothetical protein
MNIITNPTEVATVVSLVTSQVLDRIALSEKAKDAIRTWRTDMAPGRNEIETFTDEFNEALMAHIETSTKRRYFKSGGRLSRGTIEKRSRS